MFDFTALHIENATDKPYSICAISLVSFIDGKVSEKKSWKLQPPQNKYEKSNTHRHGISEIDTIHCPLFPDIYLKLKSYLNSKLIVCFNANYNVDCLLKTFDYYRNKALASKNNKTDCSYSFMENQTFPQFDFISLHTIIYNLFSDIPSNKLDEICSSIGIKANSKDISTLPIAICDLIQAIMSAAKLNNFLALKHSAEITVGQIWKHKVTVTEPTDSGPKYHEKLEMKVPCVSLNDKGSFNKIPFNKLKTDTQCNDNLLKIHTENSIGNYSNKPERTAKGKSIIDFPDNYIIIDTETTGLDPRFDSIIEISAIKVSNNQIIDTFSSLINPGFIIDEFITEKTGITNNMLQSAPQAKEIIPKFYSFVKNSILIGHNVNFDINFIYDALQCFDMKFNNNFIDTLRFARRLLPDLKHHRLQDIAEYFNINTDGSHRALRDCEITQLCYTNLKKIALSQYGTTESFANTWNNSKNNSYKSIVAQNSDFDITHPLYNKVCVFTGTLERMQRQEAMQTVANLGGICSNSITQKTNYLILGNNDYCPSIKGGKSSKQKKAESLLLNGQDIQIISENVFYEIIKND